MKKYGISFKNNEVMYVVKFDNLKNAKEWLETEEYDFRDRELMTKTKAIKYAGKKQVDNAINDYEIGY